CGSPRPWPSLLLVDVAPRAAMLTRSGARLKTGWRYATWGRRHALTAAAMPSGFRRQVRVQTDRPAHPVPATPTPSWPRRGRAGGGQPTTNPAAPGAPAPWRGRDVSAGRGRGHPPPRSPSIGERWGTAGTTAPRGAPRHRPAPSPQPPYPAPP